jgi:hypothetical protein
VIGFGAAGESRPEGSGVPLLPPGVRAPLGESPRIGWAQKLELNYRSVRAWLRRMKLLPAFALLSALGLVGCVSVKTEPIEVKPIHITVDVNVKIDRALNNFFGDLDRKAATP